MESNEFAITKSRFPFLQLVYVLSLKTFQTANVGQETDWLAEPERAHVTLATDLTMTVFEQPDVL